MRSQRSLVSRLVWATLLWAVPVLVVIALILTILTRNSTFRSFDETLGGAVTSLVSSVERTGADNIRLDGRPIDPRYQTGLSGHYWQIFELSGHSGRVDRLASPSLAGESIELSDAQLEELRAAPGGLIFLSAEGPDGEPLRMGATLFFLDRTDQPLVALAAADRRPADRSVRQFAYVASALLILLIIGLVAAIFMQVRIGLQPLFRLRGAVADVREGESSEVSGDYPPEIQPLAEELNSLITHNRDVVERARTHVGNLAHALKTPLAVLMGESAKSKSRLSDVVGRQTDIMRQQVDHHLTRARAAARAQVVGARTPVISTAQALIRTLTRIYPGKAISLGDYPSDEVSFRGESQDLQEMCGNLMDNACKWAGSQVMVSIHRDKAAAQVVIQVDDDGPGLAEDQYDEALKRGIRLDEATPGSGLGLSIVDDLARAYKGDVSLGASALGGLCVTLRLPAAG